MLSLILLVFAFVCAVLAAAAWPVGVSRPHLGWAAIAFWIAAELFGRAGSLGLIH